jgi:hypothetical protein
VPFHSCGWIGPREGPLADIREGDRNLCDRFEAKGATFESPVFESPVFESPVFESPVFDRQSSIGIL